VSNGGVGGIYHRRLSKESVPTSQRTKVASVRKTKQLPLYRMEK
jgi:hypothetical protein